MSGSTTAGKDNICLLYTSVVIEGALILCWAFAESILDVRELFAGGKVPLTKNASNWQLSLQGLPALVDKLDTDRQNDVNGLSYDCLLYTSFKIASCY